MLIDAGLCVLRPFREDEAAALVNLANDPAVARNLRDRFPHPYTPADARGWLRFLASEPDSPMHFAIEVGNELAGGIGATRRQDVERFSAEVGYWLGRSYWGRGIATAALAAFSAHLFSTTDLERLDAIVFDGNHPSCRVLEKAGFEREGRLRRAVFKNGEFADGLLYSRLRRA